MVRLSDDLTWAIVKKSQSRLIKKKASPFTFSAEVGNVVAKNERKYSTVLSKGVGAVIDAKGNTTVTMATRAAGNKPKKSVHKVRLNAFGRGTKKCNTTVDKVLAANYYRPDIARLVKARVSQSAKAGQKRALGIKYTPKQR